MLPDLLALFSAFSLMDIAILLVTGVFAGFLAGMFGIGGGVVLVPALVAVFTAQGYGEYAMHMAVGTSLAIVVPTGFVSALAHARKGALNKAALKRWAPGILLGVLCGTAAASVLDGQSMKAIFAVAIVFLAALMQIDPKKLRRLGKGKTESGAAPLAEGATKEKDDEGADVTPSALVLGCCGLGVGTLSTLMGIGGATMSVPAMSILGMNIRNAIGTAASIGVLISLPGAAGFMLIGQGQTGAAPWFMIGYVHGLAAMIILPVSVLCARLGVTAAHALPFANLKRFFSIFMVIVAVKMLWSVWG